MAGAVKCPCSAPVPGKPGVVWMHRVRLPSNSGYKFGVSFKHISVWFQLKEAGFWDSTSAVVTSPPSSSLISPVISPSKRTPSTALSPRSNRVHGRHVHQAGYQQLMDIINLPLRGVGTSQSPSIISNCSSSKTSSVTKIASSAQRFDGQNDTNIESTEDKALKPTDILVSFVDNLWPPC